jgi:hypothetical protein
MVVRVREFRMGSAWEDSVFPVYVKGADGELPDDSLYYWVAGNGIFLVKNHRLFASKTRVAEIPFLPLEAPSFEFKGPRISCTVLAQVLALFKEVWHRYRAESVVILTFDMAMESYEIEVPHQTVGGIHCVYRETPEALSERVRVGTIHSHGHEDAFYSERDDADESFQDGLHLVFGNVDGIPTLLCSGVADGHRFILDNGAVTEGMPGEDELVPWKKWVQEQIEQKVKPLKKPVYFGA